MASCVFEELINYSWWVLLLLILGSCVFLKILFHILNWVYVSFLRPAKNLRKYGSWGLITGCTDGIGKGFAFELGRKGINLVLVGRNSEKLKDVADRVTSKYPNVQIKTLVMDFSGNIDEGIKLIKETIDGLDLGILINNVGISYPYAKYFHEIDETLLNNLIKVNVEGTTKVTQAVLPGMLKKKKGAIINIGSGVAKVIPCDPLYAVYGATKGYIYQFSRSLHVEYKRFGIDVQCQVPLYVATKMSSIRKASLFAPSAEAYAKAGLRSIGYEICCTPFWTHSLIWVVLGLVPDSLIDAWRLSFCLKIRKRGMLKDARKKDQ